MLDQSYKASLMITENIKNKAISLLPKDQQKLYTYPTNAKEYGLISGWFITQKIMGKTIKDYNENLKKANNTGSQSGGFFDSRFYIINVGYLMLTQIAFNQSLSIAGRMAAGTSFGRAAENVASITRPTLKSFWNLTKASLTPNSFNVCLAILTYFKLVSPTTSLIAFMTKYYIDSIFNAVPSFFGWFGPPNKKSFFGPAPKGWFDSPRKGWLDSPTKGWFGPTPEGWFDPPPKNWIYGGADETGAEVIINEVSSVLN